jgi:hypothetical protein
MELRINLELNQIIGLIKELPYNDKLLVKSQLDKELTKNAKQSDVSLKQLLLSGPIMTDEGIRNYKELRKQFNKWTKKLSV